MGQRDDLLLAIEAIYAAATEPDYWPKALQLIADYFHDVGANLIYRRDDGSTGTIASPSLAVAHEAYEQGWWKQDIRWVRAQQFAYRSRSGAITDRDFITPEEMATLPFYTDFQAKFGLHWIASTEISPEPHAVVALSVHRGQHKPAYSDDELEMLTKLGRHAEQSLRLSIRLIRAEAASLGLGEALDKLDVGAVVLASDGTIILSNKTAGDLLPQGSQRVGERLVFGNPKHQSAFESHMLATADDIERGSDAYLAPILLSRDAPKRPLVANFLPIRSSKGSPFRALLNQAKAVLLIQDLDGEREPDPATVRDLLGVTLAEAKVAALIGSGVSPRDAAGRLGIAEETARSALKRVFQKSGIKRQSELAALIAKLAFG